MSKIEQMEDKNGELRNLTRVKWTEKDTVWSQDEEVQRLCNEYIDEGGEVTKIQTGMADGYNSAWKIATYRVKDGKATYH